MLHDQIGGALDVGDHLAGARRPGGDRWPPAPAGRGSDSSAPQVERSGIDLVVALDDVVGALQVAVQQHRRGPWDGLGRPRPPGARARRGPRRDRCGNPCAARPSAEPPGDVVLGALVVGGSRRSSSVRPNSTITPVRRSPSALTSVVKNATRSLTRAACCMLWVTITIVYSCLISCIRSSIRAVAIGSSAEHGSSIRITSGSTAMARAMHSRCC